VDQRNECEREEAYPGGFSPLRPEFHGELSGVKFSPWCDQRPQPIFIIVTYEKESLMKNIDFPQKLISNLKQSTFENRSE